jgi:hypothetical protein
MWASNKRENLMDEKPGLSVQKKRCLISEIYFSIYKKWTLPSGRSVLNQAIIQTQIETVD